MRPVAAFRDRRNPFIGTSHGHSGSQGLVRAPLGSVIRFPGSAKRSSRHPVPNSRRGCGQRLAHVRPRHSRLGQHLTGNRSRMILPQVAQNGRPGAGALLERYDPRGGLDLTLSRRKRPVHWRKILRVSYVATMRRAPAKNNLSLNLFVLKITHGSAFALGTAHTSFVLDSPLESLRLTVSLLRIGDHHGGWGR